MPDRLRSGDQALLQSGADYGPGAMLKGAGDPAHRLLHLLLGEGPLRILELQGEGQAFLPGR